MMKKPKLSKNKTTTDIEIELYCQNVAKILKNLNDKCGTRTNKETFEEEQPESIEHTEELL
jgi:hypothetical protein